MRDAAYRNLGAERETMHMLHSSETAQGEGELVD